MQDPNADTEWNDVLRSKGILPPKEEVTIDEDTVVQVRQPRWRAYRVCLVSVHHLQWAGQYLA